MSCNEQRFDVGDQVVLSAQFRDIDGALVDPTTVVCKLRDPAGTVSEFSGSAIGHPALGQFTCDIGVLQAAGRYWYRFEAAGSLVAVEEDQFVARASRVLET